MSLESIAQANANLKYGGQEAALKRAMDALRANTDSNVQSLEGYGNTGRNVLGQVYGVLDTKLAQNRQQTGEDLAKQVASIGQGYRDAGNVATAARDDARTYLEQLAERTGGQAALPEVMSGVENTASKILGRFAQNDATTTGNLQNWAAQNDSIMAGTQNIGQQMRADAGSRFENELLNALGGARLEGTKGQNDLQGRLLDILNERGSFLTSELARLASEEWQRQMEQAKLNQAAQQANAELALRSASLASENNARAYSQSRDSKGDALAQAELELKKRGMSLEENKWRSSLGADGVDTTEAWRLADIMFANDPTWALKTMPEKIADLQALGLMPSSGGSSFGVQQNRATGVAAPAVRALATAQPDQKRDTRSFWDKLKGNLMVSG